MTYALRTDRTEDRALAREIAALSRTSPFALNRALADGDPILRFDLPSAPHDAQARAQDLWSVLRVLSARGMRTRFTDESGRDVPPAAILRACRAVATRDRS